ncbi:MAG: hypothetical protein HZB39_16825 [Planctomycetes bacterium]|nr:hypothetical protein [Planctomycetota bacterium]
MLITRCAILLAGAALSIVPPAAQGIVRDVPGNTPSTGACVNAPFGDGSMATTMQFGVDSVPGARLAFRTTGGGVGLSAVQDLGPNSPDITLSVIQIALGWLLGDLAIASIQGTTQGFRTSTMNLTLPASSSLDGARVVAPSVHVKPAPTRLAATLTDRCVIA